MYGERKRGRSHGRKARGDYVYLFDMARGVEVLKLRGGGAKASARMKSVTAPSVRKADRWASKPVAGSSLSADGGFVCPLFT